MIALAPRTKLTTLALAQSRQFAIKPLAQQSTAFATHAQRSTTMALQLAPLPPSNVAGAPERKLAPEFGRLASGIDLSNLTDETFKQIEDALYKHSVLVFPNTQLSPEKQYELTQRFDPSSTSYGHGNKGRQEKSILHPDLKTIPRQPQVQVIGNGPVAQHEGLENITLKHPHHKTFHETKIPDQDDKKYTRFYRWHIDSALYDLSTPRVTTLYGLAVPKGEPQILRYDDGTGDELPVPLGTTAFVSGISMFEDLSAEEKSLAIRTRVRYAPHPYVWMSGAASNPCGLGLVSQNKELPLNQLPDWSEDKIKTLPMLWKNPSTGKLHLQVHPSAIQELLISPLPEGATRDEKSLYPDGAHITELSQVRDLVYKLQRPAIAPEKVYAHDWQPNDMCLFHNAGVLHSVVGAFKHSDVRIFHQCNLAASGDPVGPSAEDIKAYA